MTLPLASLCAFVLVAMRLTGFFLAAPIFSNVVISIRVKIALLLSLAVFLTGALPAVSLPPFTMSAMVPGIVGEIVAGLLLGFGFRLIMGVAAMAGEVIGLQMGIGMASLLDTNSGQSADVLQSFYGLIFSVLFLTLDCHHHMLRILNDSFVAIPPAKALLSAQVVPLVVAQAGEMLACGCRLAAPVIVPLFLLTTAVAVMSRAFPQANILAFAYGASIVVGMILLALSVPSLREVIVELMHGADRYTGRVIQALSGA